MSMVKPYEHTQVGWAILIATGLTALVLVPVVLFVGDVTPIVVALGALALTGALFGSLTVRVDDYYVSWRFGVGLLRKRIDLGTVRAFGVVKNPWHWGWGIRWYSGGKLFNVSGTSAIELVLRDQQRVRIGTDEPRALYAALTARLGEPLPLEATGDSHPSRRKAIIATLLVLLTLAGGLPMLMGMQARPAVVTITASEIRIENLFYSGTIAASELRSIHLVPQLPRIRLRTNGYALNGTLRGWFLLDEFGKARLFVELQHPPFLVIQSEQGFVAVNFADPSQTTQLFSELRTQFPRVAQ